ncbi:hypothetical protein FB45DRAFT_782474 [Roridomyces roridus]|uniref:BRCT domain-containing protein n=1 Tax=Roridomyces roridus TaxID=1738132 RepID=A0AAD7CFS6_9AGAR|nr:hypothetical protein FB45DRAFT_782474 [Roridomyces roridus]
MEVLETDKRVTRSQHLLPDSLLSLSRSPLKDARIAQRNYHPTEPIVPDDPDADDEILLSPAKSRPVNSRPNSSSSKRSASPPPQDEYRDPSQPDGRELKRLKRDTEDAKDDAEPDRGGSDVENTNTDVRRTAPSTHTRNLSEPSLASFLKPRSSSKRTPKGKARARSVPVFPVLDLSNPPTTPWDRRARSRSPSKERDTFKLQFSFSSLAAIPDEMVASLLRPTPLVTAEPPSTPKDSLATPMSPLTPVPATPLPVQTRPSIDLGRIEGLPPSASSLFTFTNPAPPVLSSVAEEPQISDAVEEPKAVQPRAPSRLPRPSSAMGLAPAPGASKSMPPAKKETMAPPPVPSGRSTAKPAKNAFQLMMASSARGAVGKGKGKEKEKPAPAASSTSAAPSFVAKGKGKERAEEQPKEEKKVSLKAKMRTREKPKPIPLPIHVRLPDESDAEPTSTPTAASLPVTPKITPDPPALVQAPVAPPSPLTDLDDEEAPNAEPLIDDDGPPPPVSSPEFLYSPSAGPQLMLVEEPARPAETPVAEENVADAVEIPLETPLHKDVTMGLESVPDIAMSGDKEPPVVESAPKGRPRSRLGKPRLPAPLPAPADRVTRSASLKRKDAGGGVQKRVLDAEIEKPAKKQKMSAEPGSPTKMPMASPSKTSSFAAPTKASAARATIAKPPAKNKPVSAAAPSHTPSPTKNRLARASSMFNARPPPSFARAFTGPDGNPSSLQTLASALEKLRMPPPERPNTSLGFSRDDTDNSLAESTRSMDDRHIGLGRPTAGLQRASTVASIESTSSTSSLAGESLSKSKPPTSSSVPRPKSALAQRPLAAFMTTGSGSRLAVGKGSIMRGGSSLFGGAARGRAAPKVSRNPGLPSVMGSPVKGGGGDGDVTVLVEDPIESTEASGTIERVTSPRAVTFDMSSLLDLAGSKKGKEKEQLPSEWRHHASRRASLAGQDLSKSVSLPPKSVGLMGPPETPLDRMRSTSSSYPSSSDASGTDGMRRSTRIAKNAASADNSVDEEDVVATEAQTVSQPLAILKGCTVFVDIVSEIGDDSAKLFITDMLRNLGARVLASVGQTCTHIVYKNGQRSTYTRYKALSDPKPHVVGMEWVIKSAEKRNHEDELPYVIDMDDMNTTAMKRRKSMLPRLVDNADGDQSFEGSSTSMIVDDDLAPLERARLRKAGTVGI